MRVDLGQKIRLLSESIGATKVFKTENVGWDYPSDPTLNPTAKLPDVLIVDQKFAFDEITRLTCGIKLQRCSRSYYKR